MKNSIKWILIVLLLAGIIAGASVLYNKFSTEYDGDSLAPVTETIIETEKEEAAEEAFTAPDFTVLDYDGNEVRLSDFGGKPVVVNFWATWCYYCKKEMPDFNKAHELYPDIQFMMVNATDGIQETTETAKKYIEDEGFEFDVFFDTELEAVKNYYVTGFPSTFFIDANGNLVTYANGMIDYESLEKGISMIAEQ